MRKIDLKLKYDMKGGVYKRGDNFILCYYLLSDLFTLPRARKTPITFTISDKESPNSYKVRFGENSDCQVFYEGSWQHKTLYGDADILVRKLGLSNKTVWVSVHWEE